MPHPIQTKNPGDSTATIRFEAKLVNCIVAIPGQIYYSILNGLNSLPFPRPARLGKGKTWRVAIKVIDPRGKEGLRVLTIQD